MTIMMIVMLNILMCIAKKHVNDDDDDLDEIMASMGVSNNKGNRKRKYRDDYNEGMSDFGSTTEYKGSLLILVANRLVHFIMYIFNMLKISTFFLVILLNHLIK